ncbi:MAG TPA: cold shock domain-containing protein [Allosphingosinicella sp.]|nr:cold shock domain-containing protein [Allosphingosinicella sp.]
MTLGEKPTTWQPELSKIFDDMQGFGLISPDVGTGEIVVPAGALQGAGITRLRHRQRVAFKAGLDRHGRSAARDIQLLADDSVPPRAERTIML